MLDLAYSNLNLSKFKSIVGASTLTKFPLRNENFLPMTSSVSGAFSQGFSALHIILTRRVHVSSLYLASSGSSTISTIWVA